MAAALVVAPAAASADTFTVTTTNDDFGTPCTTPEDTDCSLRDALAAANFNGSADVIKFAAGVSGGTINLDPSLGSLRIHNESLEIQGPGVGQLTISGGDNSRIFKLFGFDAPDEQVVISGLTLTNGNAQSNSGGAIYSADFGFDEFDDPDSGSAADLTVADSLIKDSAAGRGGAIALDVAEQPGALTIRTSTIDHNQALTGGGVFVSPVSKPVTVTASTLSNNSALAPQQTFRASQSNETGDGGAIALNRGDGAMLIQNSTIVANHADGVGGGVSLTVFGANPRTIRNTTIAGNTASQGGGVSVVGPSQQPPPSRGAVQTPQVNVSSTIAADNIANAVDGNSDGPDLYTQDASINAGFSLFEVTNGATITAAPPGSSITGVDPDLGVLADNGGPTKTKLPAGSSDAVDAGVGNSLATDQRGLPRTVDRPPANEPGSDGTDIGAVELAAVPPPDAEPLPGPPTLTRCLGEVLLVKRGGPESEKIEGTPQRDGIFAHAGEDLVLGLEDDDCLFGGTGKDDLEGGPDDDYAAGDPDDDVVRGNDGRDDVRGQHGDDRVFGGPGGDKRVTGGAGDDHVDGGAGNDSLIKGDGGNDVIVLGSGKDFVHAGGGRDTIKAADGEADEIICGAGDDVAFVDEFDVVMRDCNVVHVVG
jgi:CSLREA domain-containing protein